jgi:PUA domain protein
LQNFNRFNLKEDVSGQSQLKSSVQRGLRQKLLDEYPRLESVIDELWPKKATVLQLKWYIFLLV